MERLTDGLWYERETASSSLVGVRRRSTGDVEPVLRVRRGAMNGRRVHVDLVLLGGDRAVEVSFHPAATVDLVRGHAERRGADANGWMGALLRAVVEDADRWGSWTPSARNPATPLAVLGGVTHPLLGAAYDAGVAPAGEIPRWASPAVAEVSMMAAAIRLFGAAAASRAVVRALGALLLRPRVAWWQLAVASALTSVCGADDVAATLAVESEEPGGLPSAEDVAVLRAGLALLEPARAKRLAVDALAVGGARRLELALRALVDAGDGVRWPPPVRLVDLEAACLRAMAVDPAPPRPPAPRRPDPAELTRPATRTPTWTTARRAPATSGSTPEAAATFAHRPEVRALDGCLLGADLELVVPRTPDELAAWGRMLGNCLGDFGRRRRAPVRDRRRQAARFPRRRHRAPPEPARRPAVPRRPQPGATGRGGRTGAGPARPGGRVGRLPPVMRASGDGFVTLADGSRRWGRFGAAGVLVRHLGDPETEPQYFLARRSMHTHLGGTWAIPGGALDEGETPLEGALREFDEEIGVALHERDFQIAEVHEDDHGGWSYWTLVVDVADAFDPPDALTWETSEVRWVRASELHGLELFGAFRTTLERLGLYG